MEFTHFNESGRAHMVEVGEKADTRRIAVARGKIRMARETLDKIREGQIQKGDVLAVAQVAGIMGAKKTSSLVPMCHNIFLTGADLRFAFAEDGIEVEAEARTLGKTGVEMEALTAVTVACLTIYDMCKAVDKGMVLEEIRLVQKTGGKTQIGQGDGGTVSQGDPRENSGTSGGTVSGDPRGNSGTSGGTASSGRVLSVNISDKKGVVKHPLEEGVFLEGFGLEGDAHGGPWHRQVSLLGIESFEKMEAQGAEGLVPGIFAENITTEGLVLYALPIGTRLAIGETLQEVTQIGKECHTGCEIAQKVGKCVMPKEGIFTRILKGGRVRPGDEIKIIEK